MCPVCFSSVAWLITGGVSVLGATAGAFAIVGVLGQKASEVGLGVAAYGETTPVAQAFFAEL